MATTYTNESQQSTSYSLESQESTTTTIGIGTAIIGSTFIVGGGSIWDYTNESQQSTTYSLQAQT